MVSLNFFLKLIFSGNTRIRILGVFSVVLGAIMIMVAHGHEQTAALFIKYFGWFLAVFAGSILLIFTSIYKDIVLGVVQNLDALILRLFGIIGVGFGTILLYLGLTIL